MKQDGPPAQLPHESYADEATLPSPPPSPSPSPNPDPNQALRKGFEWELGGRAALLQRMESLRRENEQGTELVEEVQKARGFDRELMMAMTFHEVRNPLNGTVGHLRLAKQLVAGMRRGDVIGGNGVRDAIGGAGGYGEGSEGDRSALGALEEEVDQSIVATELAVQYLHAGHATWGAHRQP